MNKDFPEDSDTSDDDYVPTVPGTGGEVPSEVDSDGDSEDPLSDSEDIKSGKRRKRTKQRKEKKDTEAEPENDASKKEMSAEEKKKHADDIWASFKKDSSFKAKPSSNGNSTSSSSKEDSQDDKKKPIEPVDKPKPSETVKVTQIFEFAGEEVKIEKEVDANSAEARLSATSSESSSTGEPAKRKGGSLGGIGSVLSQLGKKQKLSTLEKSKLDWNSFKQKEHIEDELNNYRKGKDGYLDKQDFLQRADLRRFEIEREVRTIERNKRMNMNNLS